MKTLRIATRKSQLALWQAEYVKAELQKRTPELAVELVRVVTQGDKILDVPLAKVGGKGLFVKEIEDALLRDEADIAVHSMKDVPAELPEGLHLPVICEREDPRDAWIATNGISLADLAGGSRVGTSSLRRQVQLQAVRPDLEILMLRGNVDTRLRKLDEGAYEAIILAAAGIKRLGWGERATALLSAEQMLPAVGQGAVGIECRTADAATNALIAPLRHQQTYERVVAERAMLAALEGGCQVPIGGHALFEGETLWLRGLVGDPEDGTLIRGEVRGPAAEAAALGVALAEQLLRDGGREILKRVYAAAAK